MRVRHCLGLLQRCCWRGCLPPLLTTPPSPPQKNRRLPATAPGRNRCCATRAIAGQVTPMRLPWGARCSSMHACRPRATWPAPPAISRHAGSPMAVIARMAANASTATRRACGSIWRQKGATLSDKSARQEFGLTQEEIFGAMRAGKLQFQQNSMHGNPRPAPMLLFSG